MTVSGHAQARFMDNPFAISQKPPRWVRVFLPAKGHHVDMPLANRSDWERIVCENKHFMPVATWRQTSAKDISELCVVPADIVCARIQ